MNQTPLQKRTTQTLSSFRGKNQRQYSTRKSNTKTPEIKLRTPKKSLKGKKTPMKDEFKQDNKKQSIQPFIKNQKKPSMQMSQKDELTLCQTAHIKFQELHCTQCQNYQQKINQLQKNFNIQTKLNHEFQQKYNELKESYEKKIKKYKVKSKMQRDELKLLKWILGQRKEFSQVLQQLQVWKDNNLSERFENQKIDMIDQIGRSQERRQEDKKYLNIYDNKGVFLRNECPTSRKNQKNFSDLKQLQDLRYKDSFSSRQESLLEQQMDILQQKVMELSIKNEFLQKIKLKQQFHQLSPPYYQNNSTTFCNQVNESCKKPSENVQQSYLKRLPLHLFNKNLHDLHDKIPYQYSDDEESVSKQKKNSQSYETLVKQQNCWNVSSKQLKGFSDKTELKAIVNDSAEKIKQKKRIEVESRFISPLKDRFTDENMIQSSKKKSQIHEEKLQLHIPESRSKYCDSIKERSRLLGL